MGSNRQDRPSNFVRKIITTTLLFFALGGNTYAATITFKIGEQNYEEQGNKFIVSESVRLVDLVAILSEPLPNDLSFTYELFAVGTTATRFSDFQYNADDDPSQQQNRVTATFKIGETALPIPIVIGNDLIKEKDETIRFRMAMLSEGASLEQEDVYIEISDDEAVPIVTLFVEGQERNSLDDEIYVAADEDTGIVLTLEIINNASDQDIKITYEITYTPAPVEGEEKDYILGSDSKGTAPELILDPENVKKGIERGVLTIPALFMEHNVSLFLRGDGIPEVQENLRIELICPSDKKDENDSTCPDDELTAGAVVHSVDDSSIKSPQTIVNLVVNDINGNAGAINATGITRCYDADKQIISGCNSLDFPAQNGDNFDVDRFNRYVKLDSNGEQLDVSEAEWACVLDENTNLVWQVKATDTDFSVGDTSTYTWYNPIEHINGGNEGFTGGGAGIGEPDEQQTCASSICNTNAYLSRTAASTCRSGNWRIPNVNELLSIINFEPDDNDSGTVVSNIDYFAHTLPRFYWTSTPASVSNESAWCVYFGTTLTNHVRLCEKEEKHLVRLVKNYNPPPTE